MNKKLATLSIIAIGLTVNAAQPYKVDDNTIALWHLDEAPPVKTFVNAANPKMLLNKQGKGELKSVKGIFGRALTGFFPQGVRDNRLLAPKSVSIPNPPTQTFEAWIMWPDSRFMPRGTKNPRGGKASQVLYVRTGSLMPVKCSLDAGGPYGILCYRVAGKRGDKPQVFTAPLPTVEPEVWYHVAIVSEQKTEGLDVKLYISSASSNNVTPKPFAVHLFKNFKQTPRAYFFRIGEGAHTGANPFAGIIDEIRISKVARTIFDTLRE